MDKKTLSPYILNAVSVVLGFFVTMALLKTGIINSYYEAILVSVGINIILAVSLNLATGIMGQLALGHAGFMAVGAYASAIFTKAVDLGNAPLEFLLAMLIGGIAATISGLVIGIPVLRLKGDYLAIITLGFGEIIRVIIENLKVTGGAYGLRSIEHYSTLGWTYWVVVATVVLLFTLIRSRHGRALISIREDAIAAEASGINVVLNKIFAFAVAAFFAGVAGALYAHYIGILGAKNFGFLRSVDIVVIVVLGGMGSFSGSIIAAIVLTVLTEALRDFSSYRMLVYSVLLIVMMIYRPSGLLGQYEVSVARGLKFIADKKFLKRNTNRKERKVKEKRL